MSGLNGTTHEKPDIAAARDLIQTCHRIAQHQSTDRQATLAWIQTQMAQAATQVCIELLVRKNLIGEVELSKALARCYDELREKLERDNSILNLPPLLGVRPR